MNVDHKLMLEHVDKIYERIFEARRELYQISAALDRVLFDVNSWEIAYRDYLDQNSVTEFRKNSFRERAIQQFLNSTGKFPDAGEIEELFPGE